MPPESDTTPRQYAALNAMRGVAAIAVVFFHGAPLLGRIAPAGYLAVDFFFVLSGFVIAHAYGGRLRDGLKLREFVMIRLIRFYPLYLAGLGLGLVNELMLLATRNAFALPIGSLALVAAAGVLFLPMPLAARDGALFPANVPSWSLFFELVANIAYALIQPWLRPAMLFAAMLLSAAFLVLSVPADGIGHVGVGVSTFGTGCARTIFSFSVGILIHRLNPRVPTLPLPYLLIATAAPFALIANSRLYDLAFVFLVSPMLVTLGTAVEPPATFARHARFLGLVSFPIYALHRPVLSMAQAFSHRVTIPPATIGWATLVVLLIFCSTIALRFDETARATISGWRKRRLPVDRAETAAP